MAVAVIGFNPLFQKRKEGCVTCGSILEYTSADVIVQTHTDYLGDTEYVPVIVCPTCNSAVQVPSDAWNGRL